MYEQVGGRPTWGAGLCQPEKSDRFMRCGSKKTVRHATERVQEKWPLIHSHVSWSAVQLMLVVSGALQVSKEYKAYKGRHEKEEELSEFEKDMQALYKGGSKKSRDYKEPR